MSKKPTVLLILDGYGLSDKVEGNAVAQANTPVMDKLMKEYPFVKGYASGMAGFLTDRWVIQKLAILIWVQEELFIRN
jgi:2,3-bisphosphoglycerate-independent phosphoglycerate mutase